MNGDGKLEWDEFTGFCLEAGMTATRGFSEPLGYKYEHRTQYHDTTTTGEHIEDICFVPELRRVFVCEGGSPTVRIYDTQLRLVRELQTDTPFGSGGGRGPGGTTSSLGGVRGLLPLPRARCKAPTR